MYNTIWKYLKYFVLAVGFFTLALIFYITVLALISHFSHNKVPESQPPREIYSKDFGTLQLKIFRDENTNGQLLLNIDRNKKSVVANYEVKDGDDDESWLNVTNAKVIRLANDEQGIVIFSANEECDHCDSSQKIWLYKLGKELKLAKVISLSNLNQIGENSDHYFAYKQISTPYQEEMPGMQVLVPVEIEIGSKVKFTPILSPQGSALIKSFAQEKLAASTSKASQSGDRELMDKLKNAAQQLDEALAPQAVSF